MARIARVVVPRPAASCHPAPQSPRAGVFRGRGLSALPPPDRDGGASRRRGDLGLLPNAQSCPSDRDASRRRWVAGDVCRSAPALHGDHQRAVPLDGASVPRPLRRSGNGRAAPAGGRALHRAQSGSRGVGEPRRRLAVVERPRASRGRGRRVGEGNPAARLGARFCRASGSAGPTRRRRPGSSAGPPSDDRWGRRNGWRSSSAGSGAHWHPASPGQNPEWSRPSHGKPDCCDALYKLSP